MRRRRSKLKEGVALVAKIAIVGFLVHAASTVGLPPKSTPPDYISYTVQPGDTIWTIADRLANDTSNNEIQNIMHDNALINSYIMPGTKLTIQVRNK